MGIVKEVLTQLGCNADDVESIAQIKALGSRIVCLSCPIPIRMDFHTLVRRSFVIG